MMMQSMMMQFQQQQQVAMQPAVMQPQIQPHPYQVQMNSEASRPSPFTITNDNALPPTHLPTYSSSNIYSTNSVSSTPLSDHQQGWDKSEPPLKKSKFGGMLETVGTEYSTEPMNHPRTSFNQNHSTRFRNPNQHGFQQRPPAPPRGQNRFSSPPSSNPYSTGTASANRDQQFDQSRAQRPNQPSGWKDGTNDQFRDRDNRRPESSQRPRFDRPRLDRPAGGRFDGPPRTERPRFDGPRPRPGRFDGPPR